VLITSSLGIDDVHGGDSTFAGHNADRRPSVSPCSERSRETLSLERLR
jgi:hypothetical protein